jgi:signal transduction histidine kinase
MTPSYIFLIWRWGTWVYALIIILNFRPSFISPETTRLGIFLLVVTFVQSLIGTLYAPIFQVLLPRLPRIGADRMPRFQSRNVGKPRTRDTSHPVSSPVPTHMSGWNVLIYVLDVLVCGLVVYFSGPNGGSPFFGDSSPFYRYGMSVALAAAFAYGYRGAITAALAYDCFTILGLFLPAPGAPKGYVPNVIDIVSAVIDTPLVALIAAYLASLLANYARSRQREQDNVRRQRALVQVGETLIRGASGSPGNVSSLLQQTITQLRQGGHFQRLLVALVGSGNDERMNDENATLHVLTAIESDVMGDIRELPKESEESREPLMRVLHTKNRVLDFDAREAENSGNYGTASLYLPFFKEKRMQLIVGAESTRQTPFGEKQEEFLTIAGTQLLVALDNIRLTEQTIELAATAERGRIAREIHDGVAQLVYMLSLNVETCAAQAHRIAEASDEDAELVTPLASRLDTLVSISKQALWETRSYMFTLKPFLAERLNGGNGHGRSLLGEDMSLSQMLTNQVREFQTISGLPTDLTVEGSEELLPPDTLRSQRYAQVGAALFRIVQEALTNAYKHAQATQLWVRLVYTPEQIAVEICDNGHGTMQNVQANGQRLYSGQGVRGMRERATELGGTFELAPLADNGIRVHVMIPL